MARTSTAAAADAPHNDVATGLNVLLGFLNGLVILLLFVKMYWYGIDRFALATFLVSAFGWVAIAMLHTANDVKASVKIAAPKIWRVVTLLSAAALFLTFTPTGDRYYPAGVWVNGNKSTLSRNVLALIPFWDKVSFIPGDFQPFLSVQATTADGIPLSCESRAWGIVLDRRDVEKLERFIIEKNGVGDPASFIAGTLNAAVARASEQAIAARTSDDIIRQSAFVIPYHVGTPLGDGLASLRLMWQDGTVSFTCHVWFKASKL